MKVQKISGKVIKKGRKWLKIVQEGRNEDYPEDLLINQLTENLKEGDTFKDLSVETVCTKQYRGGYKFTHTATSEEILKQAEISKWWGYVQKTYKEDHRIYHNGVSKLHALGCHEHDNEIAEMTKEVEVSNAISWIRHNFKENNYIYEKGIATLGKYGITEYDDEISEMYRKIEEQKEIEERKYIHWNERAFSYKGISNRIEKGTIVIRNDDAVKVISSHYCDSESAGYPWNIYEYKGIIVTETDEGQKAIAEHKAKQEKERAEMQLKRDREALIETLKIKIKENDTLHHAETGMPSGDTIYDTMNIYGGGSCIIVTQTHVWYVINNGGDGDDWSFNHITTGGAGAYGYKCDIDLVADIIKKLEN